MIKVVNAFDMSPTCAYIHINVTESSDSLWKVIGIMKGSSNHYVTIMQGLCKLDSKQAASLTQVERKDDVFWRIAKISSNRRLHNCAEA